MHRTHAGGSQKAAIFGVRVVRETLVFQRRRRSARVKKRRILQLSSLFAPLERFSRAKSFNRNDLTIGPPAQSAFTIQAMQQSVAGLDAVAGLSEAGRVALRPGSCCLTEGFARQANHHRAVALPSDLPNNSEAKRDLAESSASWGAIAPQKICRQMIGRRLYQVRCRMIDVTAIRAAQIAPSCQCWITT
jgi:hypothetical protein